VLRAALSAAIQKALVAAGLAAGLAAWLPAPIAGVFFAFEGVLGREVQGGPACGAVSGGGSEFLPDHQAVALAMSRYFAAPPMSALPVGVARFYLGLGVLAAEFLGLVSLCWRKAQVGRPNASLERARSLVAQMPRWLRVGVMGPGFPGARGWLRHDRRPCSALRAALPSPACWPCWVVKPAGHGLSNANVVFVGGGFCSFPVPWAVW